MYALPPDVIHQFLGQSDELIRRMETDAAALRAAPGDSHVADRIAGALSVLRTSAAFLNLFDLEQSAARASELLCALDPLSDDSIERLATAIRAIRACRETVKHAAALAAPADAAPAKKKRAAVERRALRLPEEKAALAEFMVEDLRDGIAVTEQAADRAASPVGRSAGAAELVRAGADLERIGVFFEIDEMRSLAAALARAGQVLPGLGDEALNQVLPRVRAVIELLRELADALAYSTVVLRPVDGLCEAVDALAGLRDAALAARLPKECPPLRALELDGVIARASDADPSVIPDSAPIAPAIAESSVPDRTASGDAARIEREVASVSGEAPSPRLDLAASAMGDVVIHANRLSGLRQNIPATPELVHVAGKVGGIAADVARAASDLRAAVLDARVVPLAILFGVCADAIQAAAARQGFPISHTIEGHALELDIGVVDRLRGPLATLCALCASSIRPDADAPAISLVATIDGQTDTATVALHAHARAGFIDPAADEIAAARAAVEAIRGQVSVQVRPTGEVQCVLRVPTNLAFLHCAVVRIGTTLAALPMSGVEEIVRPEPDQIVASGAGRAMLIRDGAAALLDGQEFFGEPHEARVPAPYAVVLAHQGQRVALTCARALGAQEVVVRPVAPLPARVGPVSGVAAAGDGAAALIVDIPGLVRMTQGRAGTFGIAA